MRPAVRGLCWFTLLGVVSACSGDAPPAATVRDSAGVAIVSVTLPDPIPPLELVPMDTLGDSPDDVLYGVRGAAFLPDGGLVVANEGELEVRVYGPEGRLLRTLGRHGGGPCEFSRRVSMVGLLGDSVVVSDRSAHRVTVFPLAGEGCRTFPLELPERGWPFTTWGAGVLSSHRVVLNGQVPGDAAEEEGINRIPWWAAVVDAKTGAILTDLGDVGAHDLSVLRAGRDGPMMLLGRTRFGASLRVETHDSLVYVFDNRSFEVRAVDAEGRLRHILRVPDWTPRPVDDDVRERWVEWRARRADAEGGDYGEARQTLAGVELPEAMAAYQEGHVDGGGRIWVNPYGLWDASADHWVVIEPDGRIAGLATLPYDVPILAASTDRLAVLERGPQNQEYIVRYRWSPP